MIEIKIRIKEENGLGTEISITEVGGHTMAEYILSESIIKLADILTSPRRRKGIADEVLGDKDGN